MNIKGTIRFTSLLLAVLFGSCKNKAVDYSLFEIKDEHIQAESTNAVISGAYSFRGEVNGMKFNLGTNENLSDALIYDMLLEGDEFSITLDSLIPNTTYYYCYNVDFGLQKDYLTEVSSFNTLRGAPTVKTVEAVAINLVSYQVKCEAVSDGGGAISERGIYWNTNGNPGVNDHKVKHTENGVGEYTCIMEDLEPNTKYFVRAYAMNDKGVGLGNVIDFTTGNGPGLPEVNTFEVSEITVTSAKCGGEVISDGGSLVIRRGVCWSTEQQPTIENDTTVNDSGLGGFVSILANLAPNTTYYVRAYASNSSGTGYGEPLLFTTKDSLPKVKTNPVTDINTEENTAIGHGEVIDQGASGILERGICWALTHNPETTDNYKPSETEADVFSVTMDELLPNQTYYVRAYARNTQGIAYSDNEVSFIIEIEIEKPTVTLDSVTNISTDRATVYGSLINNGGSEVTEMGICWGTSANPNTGGEHVSVDVVSGSFSRTLNGLSSGTPYHVRAYAVNNVGTAYSDDKTFTTTASLISKPVVRTHAEVTDITQTSAFCGGTVIYDGGSAIIERGLCWSTHANPTVDDFTTQIGEGLGDFSGMFNGLTMATTYYLRAYAKNTEKIGYGEERVFVTAAANHPEGALDGLFSVAPDKKVWFSKGNLQYKASTKTWRFAENQYDIIGDANNNISPTYNGWIDLFGWGTSGYDHGAECCQPWSTSQNYYDYYAYEQYIYNLYDQTGQADWGYNAISNGGNQIGQWRTLTRSEWDYIFDMRSTPSGIRYAKALVTDVSGVILLPDNWNANTYSLNNTNQSEASYNGNIITASQWNTLKNAGAVFLPAACSRDGALLGSVVSFGGYWSASYSNSNNAFGVIFYDHSLYSSFGEYRYLGYSVRLVAPAE